jgi:SOS-response transcriptional repressor LexA
MEVKPLTDIQKETLFYIIGFVKEFYYQPSYSEICDHFGIASKQAVACRLRGIERKGWIAIPYGGKRAILIDGEAIALYERERGSLGKSRDDVE